MSSSRHSPFEDRPSWHIDHQARSRTQLATLSETLRTMTASIGDHHPHSYGFHSPLIKSPLIHSPLKRQVHDKATKESRFIKSFVTSFINYKNLEYLPLEDKENFIVELQIGLRDRVISEEMYDEMVQALDRLYRQQTLLEAYTYSRRRTPEDNGNSLAIVLIEFEEANAHFNMVVDKFLDYYNVASDFCSQQDFCTSPCKFLDGECMYPYDKQSYHDYWNSHITI